MKPQPRPALAVKPASMWRPRGERGLPSCLARFLTLARGFPRWRGLRSRGAGSPLTNVPVSRQQAPARPCHSCLPHGPRESACGCPFQVKSSGKRQVPPPRPPKDCRIPAPPPAGAAPGAASAGRVLARRRREPKQVWGDGNHGQGRPDPYLPSSSPFPPRLPPRGPGSAWEPGSVGRLGRDSGNQSRPRVRVPRVPGVSTCPHVRSSGKGRRGDPATRWRGGRLVVIYGRPDSRSWVASAAPGIGRGAWVNRRGGGAWTPEQRRARGGLRRPGEISSERPPPPRRVGGGATRRQTWSAPRAAPASCFNRLGEVGTLSGRRRLSSLPVFVVYRLHFGELSFRWDINLVKR